MYTVEDSRTGKLRTFLDLATAIAMGTTWVFVVENGVARVVDMPMIGITR